jgi:hypothetical protein
MALGDITRIDDRTVFVLGQVLDIAKNQPDVANALVHRVQDTVFFIDTGVTTPFRNAMRRAVDMVGPWKRLVLLTTHGHVDHIGNNDLVDELAAQRSTPVQHFVPAKDLAQMRDPKAYWTRTFGRICRRGPDAGAAGPGGRQGRIAVQADDGIRPHHKDVRRATPGANHHRVGAAVRLVVRRRRGPGAAQPGRWGRPRDRASAGQPGPAPGRRGERTVRGDWPTPTRPSWSAP